MSDNHRPLYTETQEQANEVLRLALPLMAQHRIAPHPHNFSVWYEYASGRNKVLSETEAPVILNDLAWLYREQQQLDSELG